jgi:hypothetical protein
LKKIEFNRKLDFTTVNKSLTWEEWFCINADMVEHKMISHRDYTPVIPKMGGFWVLDEYHDFNFIDKNCISCGKIFPAHFEENILCSQCFVNFEKEFHWYGELKQKAWLLETYGSEFGIRKVNKDPQMKLF